MYRPLQPFFYFQIRFYTFLLPLVKFWYEKPLSVLIFSLLYLALPGRTLCKQQAHFYKELLAEHLESVQLNELSFVLN